LDCRCYEGNGNVDQRSGSFLKADDSAALDILWLNELNKYSHGFSGGKFNETLERVESILRILNASF